LVTHNNLVYLQPQSPDEKPTF